MAWLVDVCPNDFGWESWLILCAAVVVLWAAAIAGATALFHASAGFRCSVRRERRDSLELPVLKETDR